MRIQANYSLKNRNTFRIDVKAHYFVEIEKQSDITTLRSDLKIAALPWMIMGGGSNLLFTHDLDKVVVTCRFKKIKVVKEDADNVWLSVGAGMDWHTFVEHTVDQGYWGLENLALIPGTVGAAPVQNIGAYGAEAEDTITRVQALNLFNGERKEFRHSDCQFGYRQSIFKTEYENSLLVHRVTFRLRKAHAGQPNLYYEPLKEALSDREKSELTSRDVFDAVVKIRQNRIPDPHIYGNAGSFFKNPIVSEEYFQELVEKHGDIPYHKMLDNQYKIPAAWLIEQAGWKGKKTRNKAAGVSEKHALFLVNYGDAKGEDIVMLSQSIREDIDHKFGIHLEREVIILK
ncbi:UDP-N-acetylmuramate dehydrogenase [Hydrogenovibrio sp. JE_KL2]|uniref:UDP-N-acetylmuramate dehydrogenase n=1 Tax=Hydrogenovibrio sp. JE_KL2 TaxID=2651188 RepID=UPI00128C2090|nr:UDP-N-acetylmuramate dehydrogenase [Hydrogenovibrio sp. JE_KL2]MPQ76083.1 UDP-N-acetylmuramate dehydrogenase [Hydrogenovibrio sp. JE_KL2]